MDEKLGKWVRRENERSRVLWVVAISTLAVTGFALAGVAGIAAAGPVKISLAPSNVGTPDVPAISHPPVVTPGHPSGVTKTTSTNWAGYADTVPSADYGTITEVLGEWKVPKVKCNVYSPSIQDNWIGIDGFSTSTVEQGGTIAECSSAGATPSYYDWYEFYPYNDVTTVNSVSAGDSMEGYVTYAASTGVYVITIDDLTHSGDSFTYTGNPSTCNSSGCESGSDGSAECISESLTGEGYYLPDYGTTTFTTCQAWINGYHSGIGGLPSGAHATVYAITQDSPITGGTQQSVGSLSTNLYTDDEFTITWHSYY
jgi:hypothetical protein